MTMRSLMVIAALTLLSGCSTYLSLKPPVIEDKVGKFGQEMVGTLATAADYRVVYVKLTPDAKLCAEAPADVAAQVAQTFAAAATAPTGKGVALDAQARAGLAVSLRQIFKRSQGVQLYRDGAFALCNSFLNGGVTAEQYRAELAALRETAEKLITAEIPFLEKLTIDPIAVPTAPVPPDSVKDSPSK